ncbi:MAG: hypothetical protein ABIP27_17380 [Flavobacterium circumlabens]|uniref:hypothetical protein n=1 Tax=Flavobacterium circumlabens TaxID=2133765 RepID=UPI003264ADF9
MKSVPVSNSNSDNVLVHGVDNIVKYVPRSQFSSTPTFGQVVNEGFFANRGIAINASSGAYGGQAYLDFNYLRFSDIPNSRSASFETTALTFSNDANTYNLAYMYNGIQVGYRKFLFPTPTIPEDGNVYPFTLLTTADVTVQKAIEGNPDAYSEYGKLTLLGHVVQVQNPSGSEVSYLNSYTIQTSDNNTNKGVQMYNNGTIRLSTLGNAQTFLTETNTSSEPRDIRFPDKNGTLATNDEIPVIFEWNTTSVPGAADLNLQFPQAKKGDKVNCFDITAGAMQYENTGSHWISHPLTIVPE